MSRMTVELDRGIKLYKQGDFDGARDAFQAAVKRKKEDITAWHYLGLTFAKLGKSEDARKAHERSVKIADSFLENAVAITKEQLLEAADSADQYVALSANLSNHKLEEWRDWSSYFRTIAAGDNRDLSIMKDSEVDTKVRVLSKPNPSYTDRARANQVSGTVVLRCVFTADGRVRYIHPVVGLPDGLTESAIDAARKIKFIPATKDGRPVSMWMELQYNFNLY
jgi:TonB family protein